MGRPVRAIFVVAMVAGKLRQLPFTDNYLLIFFFFNFQSTLLKNNNNKK